MNLHGYHVDLVESGAWIRHLFADGHGRGTLLYSQRQFFLGRPNPQGGGRRARPFEAYLADGQRQLHASRTRALLNRLEIREAPLDADLLHAYFDYYRRAGLLPPRALDGEETLTLEGLLRSEWSLSGVDGTARRWPEAERTRITSDDGLLSEIAAARVSGSVGLWRLHFRDNAAGEGRGPNSAVLKAKASDRLIQDLTVQLAGVCRPELGKLFGRFRDALGLAGSHERELALYELDEPRLRKHMPARFGTLRDPVNGRWALLLEYLPEAATGAGLLQLGASDPGMKAVLNGLAQIHAVWFGREAELAAEPWLAATPDKDRMNEMRPLWRELADFAAPCFEAWCGSEVRKLQATFIGDLGSWWPRLRSLPATLIHNDFNPRNMVLRQADGLPQLCVYDWELATLGIPQHDLAELLCFTFRSDATKEDLQAVADAYREILSSVCGQEIYLPEWRAGFTLALRHLLIDRLAMYSLMHRFRRLEYLPRVMGNWMRIYGWAKDWVDF
jgi:hypothetical protein